MKFGAVPVADAEGSVAVHSIRQSGLVLKKGTLIGKVEIAALKAAGITEIVVARIEPGDVSEDEAAAAIAAAVTQIVIVGQLLRMTSLAAMQSPLLLLRVVSRILH